MSNYKISKTMRYEAQGVGRPIYGCEILDFYEKIQIKIYSRRFWEILGFSFVRRI